MNKQIIKRLRGSKVVVHSDEHYTETFFVRVQKNTTRDSLYLEASNKYETWCKHSRDCCGYYYASLHYKKIRRVKRGEYAITLDYYRNI